VGILSLMRSRIPTAAERSKDLSAGMQGWLMASSSSFPEASFNGSRRLTRAAIRWPPVLTTRGLVKTIVDRTVKSGITDIPEPRT